MTFALAISDFSVGEGVYPAEALLRLAKGLGYTELVLWDRGLAGYPKLRAELQWLDEQAGAAKGDPLGSAFGLRIHLGCRFTWRGLEYGALPLSRAGHANLCRLITDQAFGREGELPGDCALLAEDLVGLDRLLREGRYGLLLAHPRRAQEALKALRQGLPVVAPQVLRFRTAEGLTLHRLKRAIATQATVLRTEPLWVPEEAAVPRAVWEARYPGGDLTLQRTTGDLLAQLSAWSLSWGAWVSAGPLGLGEAPGEADVALRQKVEAGLMDRYGGLGPAVRARLEHELDLIRRKGFAPYFLLVQDLVQAPGLGLSRTCGRGSGAASLVSYALKLTNVDPIGTNLMFERFLSEARVDPPDLDIDFAWDERDRAIQSAFERYGRDRVAMVANHVFYKPKSALRAVALAHGRPEAELKQLAQAVRGWDGGLEEALGRNAAWAPLVQQAGWLRGHFCQFSVHPGGTVITPGPLWEHVPFQPAPAKEGVAITQWDKDGVEMYGLVKIDLLGNRSLAVIRDAYEVLGAKVPPRIDQHSRQDPATRHLLAQGDSIGVFYVESPATRQLQQRVGRGDFETLVIHSSLIRPASNKWIDTYVKRVRGEEAFRPSHPVFANLLSESYGVLVYQEDILRVAVEMAGWSHDEADQLRKVLGKDDCARKLPRFEARFREGCAARGIPPEVVEESWSMVQSFRGYSFCKPHSASYAQVSFESAWIKAHHPAVFFASVITNQGGFYPAIAYLGDARRHRVVVRGPDVNASQWRFHAEGEQALRVGLMQVKGARQEEVEALVAERERGGCFADLGDLLTRVPLSVPTVEALCAGGAFDRWAPDGDRTRLLWERLGGVPQGVRPRPTDAFERAELELDTLGLTLEIHPAALARVRRPLGPHRISDAQQPGRRLKLWALVVADKVVPTEQGDPMQFVTLEDETGLLECVAFPPAFARRKRPYRVGEVAAVQGRSTRQDGLVIFELEG